MERYNEYKDSGVQWLGEIPSHWDLKHLRNFLTIFSEKGHGDKQLLSVTREKGVILRDKDNKEENHNFVPDDLSGYKHLCAGDFVINKMKSWQGSYGVSEYEGIVSPAYFTCKLRGVDPKFFSRAIRSKAYIGFFMQYSKGIRVDQWDLDPNSMKDIPFVLPTLPEQQAIATYLDTVTSKIDEAIAQQQKMIDLLNERKQIIINNAVTKGLNPDAPMKDSGVDWIGKIPEHWMTRRMRYLCKIKTGDKDTINRVDEGKYPFYVRSPKVERINSYTFDGEAVLMAGDGVGAGKVFHYVNGKFGCHQRVYIFHDIKNINGEYLYFYMKSLFKHTIEQLSAKSTVDSVRLNMIQDFIVAIPTNEEQTSILSYLHKQIEKFDVAIANATKQISLLQERKQIIINDVVTGKVKVS